MMTGSQQNLTQSLAFHVRSRINLATSGLRLLTQFQTQKETEGPDWDASSTDLTLEQLLIRIGKTIAVSQFKCVLGAPASLVGN